jgi:quinol monooxygenase YgiN
MVVGGSLPRSLTGLLARPQQRNAKEADTSPDARSQLPNLRGMITVIAHYRTHREKAAEVRALLTRHSRASAAEAGCIQFLAYQDTEDPARFALYEIYEDDAAFAAHRRSDHFRVNIEQTVVPMLVEREWHVYNVLR